MLRPGGHRGLGLRHRSPPIPGCVSQGGRWGQKLPRNGGPGGWGLPTVGAGTPPEGAGESPASREQGWWRGVWGTPEPLCLGGGHGWGTAWNPIRCVGCEKGPQWLGGRGGPRHPLSVCPLCLSTSPGLGLSGMLLHRAGPPQVLSSQNTPQGRSRPSGWGALRPGTATENETLSREGLSVGWAQEGGQHPWGGLGGQGPSLHCVVEFPHRKACLPVNG